MKKRTKIMIIILLTVIAVGLIVSLFIMQYNKQKEGAEIDETIFAKNIIDPDRIVYRNTNGQYYQFEKGTAPYNQIKESIQKSLKKL